jgi:fimbrial chaperone protein
VADFQLQNTSNEERTVQVDINAWQQIGGRDQLLPSGKLIVHPESVRLQPGESAQVRVALRLSGPLWDEQAFQLQLTETPRIPDVGSATPYSERDRVVHRSSVQVFLVPPGKVGPRVSWNVDRSEDGAVTLRAINSGRAHVQLHSASLAGPNNQRIELKNLTTVILPGGSRSWSLLEDATGGIWQLTANTNAGRMQADLELGPTFTSSRSLTLTP